MKIARIEVTPVNLPFVAPIRWSGGANADWTRLVIRMHTDDGLCGLGETLGGTVTKALIDTEIAAMFIGENPFDLGRILAKTTFVPVYFGKCGHCAVAGLELACWDLMGKAVGKPLCDLLGGRLREEIAFAAYLYYRSPDANGRGGIDTIDNVLARASELVKRHGFGTIKYKGGVKPAEEELETLAALRRAFPQAQLRYDPQCAYTPAMSLRIASRIAPLDLEYLEDPCWGNEGMARLRERSTVPLATNMCVVDLDGVAEGLRMRSVDVVLGDLFEWGGITQLRKLQGACEIFQLNLNFHSAAEFGIGTAAYLHLAAAATALPHALDTHICELVGDVVKDGSIVLTDRGTMRVPTGPGLGVELDEDKFAVAAEAHRRQGDRSIYAEDTARSGAGPGVSIQ